MAESTTSNSIVDVPEVVSQPQSKPASPKAPLRKHKSKVDKPRVEAQSTESTPDTNVECLSRLEVPDDKKVLKTKPDSPRIRTKALTEGELRRQKIIEQLHQETAVLKRTLESERSAFREARAQYEAESRRERAEGRRREASLEGQLRSALKGNSVPVPPTSESNLAAALEATKAANKCLQQKLQVLTEADKRKASELRTQHDAHVIQLQQLEKRARAQTAQLLEELKAKERQLSQATGRNLARGKHLTTGSQGNLNLIKPSTKMGVAEQLHLMEGQISRLESELQRRDDIIQSLRNSKSKRGKLLDSLQSGKDNNISKDTISDADSAVSSGPNSLSPQPSPDLWFQNQETSLVNVEGLLETARRQVQELEMSLSISKAGHQNAQLRATQLEEQLQDLREHADLLEFRCLELEDTNEKRNALEELTDCDSGCTSPEVCLKNSLSPPLRRSDSGYKSPTRRPSSPKSKCHRMLKTPTLSIAENVTLMQNDDSSTNKLNLDVACTESLPGNRHENIDIRHRLERILSKTPCEEDKTCLEEVLNLLWNLRSLSSSFIEDDLTANKKRAFDVECMKGDIEQTKANKIIATISPYTQTAFEDSNNLSNSFLNDETNLLKIKSESKKLLLGLHESGIFDDSDWDSKETQTEWCDFTSTEPESDLATEVQRLNQIKEELEKSGAIRNKKLTINCSKSDEPFYEYCETEKMHLPNKKHLDYYENRISLLENKISIYESSNDVQEKKLAQRLQREINLQTRVKILEDDLQILKDKYATLEEDYCELEEIENDTRLHCQMLQNEFEIQSTKLRDIDEERSYARNEADCFRALVDEYENKASYLQEQEKELKERIKMMENAVPTLVFWNIWKIVDKYPDFDFKTAYKNKFSNLSLGLDSDEPLQPEILAMIEYLGNKSDTDIQSNFEEQLHSLGENNEVPNKYKFQEDMLRSKMSTIEKIVLENSVLCKKQEEAAASKIKALEEELKSIKEKPYESNETKVPSCDDSCKAKLQLLIDKEFELKERIKALENREVVLLMTLTQADEMWAGVENKYKIQLKQFEENELILKEQMKEFENERNKLKTKCQPLEQKVCELEESELKLEKTLKKFSLDNKDLQSKVTTLEDQLSILKIDLQLSKERMKTMDEKHKNELLLHKKKVGVAREELQVQKKQQIDGDEEYNSKLSQVKKQLAKTSKELQEMEVNNGELKEEVETLEKEVQKLSKELSKQHIENEEHIKSLLEELTSKSKEAEKLKSTLTDYQRLPSAQEELEEINEQLSNNIKSTIIGNTVLEPIENNSNNVLSEEIIHQNKRSHDNLINREKPALPKRKPKLTPENLKLKIDIHKLIKNNKFSEMTPKQSSIDATNNHQKESLIKAQSVNELQNQSLENKNLTNILSLDDACGINKNILNALKQLMNCKNCVEKVEGYLQESLNILRKNSLDSSEPVTNSSNSPNEKNTLNKQLESTTITPDDVNQEQMNDTTQIVGKIRNEFNKFNSISPKEISPINFPRQINNKPMGVFVFDRVSKLLTNANASNPTPEYQQPSLIDDVNRLIGKNVYICNL